MNLQAGIVGLPNAGKSTLFNALLSRQIAQTASYPFTTIEPNIGIVPIINPDLPKIAKISKSKETIYSTIKFVDIAGLVKDAHKGEGLGNQFLAHIKEVNLTIYVLRAFEDDNIPKSGKNPKDDFEILKTELILKDLQTLNKQEPPKTNIKEEELFYHAVLKIKKALERGSPASEVNLSNEEKQLTKNLFLLTAKPTLFVLNISESDHKSIKKIKSQYKHWDIIPICAKLEEQLSSFTPEEKSQYLSQNGIKKCALDTLITKAFQKLNLISFITTNLNQTHSWNIKKGTTAIEAARSVHTDFAKKFIKAQVTKVEDFLTHQGWKGLKEKGLVKLEGKDYTVKDNDIIQFLIST